MPTRKRGRAACCLSRASRFLPLMVLLTTSPTPVESQEVFGQLEGVVVDRSEAGIEQVEIRLQDQQSGRTTVTRSDERGRFVVDRVTVGRYRVTFARIGYRAAVHVNVPVQLGATTSLGTVVLEPQAVQLDTLVVEPSAVVIDPTTASARVNLDPTTFRTLPTGRDYQSIIALLPQANESFYGDEFNVSGSTGLENAHFVDGVNVTDPQLGATGIQLPYNFVQEIQLVQGGYEAEFGRALGGIVNLVTHSGGNELDVNAFGYFTNDRLTATPKLGLIDRRVGSSSTYDLGVRVSGPIARDRLWFSTAYNPRLARNGIELQGHGVFDDKRVAHVFAGKLTWQAGPNTDIMLSLLGDPTKHEVVGPLPIGFSPPDSLLNPDPFLWVQRSGTVALSLNGRHRANDWLSVEAAASWSKGSRDWSGTTSTAHNEPGFQDLEFNTLGGGIGFTQRMSVSRLATELHATLILGSHTTKLGLEYEVVALDGTMKTTDPGFLIRYNSAEYELYEWLDAGTFTNRVPVVFVQDAWRVTDRLLINAGVRWDGQFLATEGDVTQAFRNPFQPRLGIVLQPGERGSEKVTASFGRFYQQFPLMFSFLFYVPVEEVSTYYAADPRTPGVQPIGELDLGGSLLDEFLDIGGARGEHIDEFTVGYERSVTRDMKLSVRGIHRNLRAAWGSALNPDTVWAVGNIGEGAMSFLPKPVRRYWAIEVSAMKHTGNVRLVGSYVLSRAVGNYTGLYSSDQRIANPGGNESLRIAEQAVNSEGLLPNDRTHVLKLSGSYAFDFGLTAGGAFTVQSGTPLNLFGATRLGGPSKPAFLVPRGSAGRTPALWDLNLRFLYRLPVSQRARLIVDVLHLGNAQRPVVLEQQQFFDLDEAGNQINPNPTFGEVLTYQPPTTVRIGFDIGLRP